jgi:DNA repair protein RadC
MKESYFDGYEYKGIRIRTKLDIQGHGQYKPLHIKESGDVYRIFENLWESDKERFYSLHLDSANNVIGAELVSQGSLNTTPIHPREVFKSAILSSANSLIFVHSHPSGDPTPSKEDWCVTDRLKEVGRLLGIDVLDHLIIGFDDYYSFTDGFARAKRGCANYAEVRVKRQ